MSRLFLTLVTFLLAVSAWYSWARAKGPEYIGIDFVQFHFTGLHVACEGDPRVWTPEVRSAILQSSWQRAATSRGTRLFDAIEYRQERIWETYSSPLLYSAFAMMAGKCPTDDSVAVEFSHADRYEQALVLYHAISISFTLIGIVSFGAILKIPKSAMLLGAFVLLAYTPIRIDLNVGNVNQIQFGMVGVLAWLLRDRTGSSQDVGICEVGKHPFGNRDRLFERHAAAGIWLGLCLAFKPSLIWCGVVWFGLMIVRLVRESFDQKTLYRQDAIRHMGTPGFVGKPARTAIIAASLGGLFGGHLAITISGIWFPVESWLEWIAAVRSMPDVGISTDIGNFSATYYGQHTLGLPTWLLAMVGPALAILSVSVLVWRGPGPLHQLEGRTDESALLLAMACQVQLLTLHLVWYHYFVLSLPAVLVLTQRAVVSSSRVEQAVLAICIVWCLLLLGMTGFDEWLASSPTEHFHRCLVANGLLFFSICMPTMKHSPNHMLRLRML
jgi:hypothetical protein